MHSALKCLAEVARARGVETSAERLRHDYALDAGEPSTRLVLSIANAIGLQARSLRVKWADLGGLDQAFPIIARLRNGNCVLIVGFETLNDTPVTMIRDPLAGSPAPLPLDETRLKAAWNGDAILVKRATLDEEDETPFGFAWFMPLIMTHRRIFRDVAVAALVLSVLAVAMPVFVQIIIDRVLVHHSLGTLNVLVVGMAGAVLFETVFLYLRRRLMLYASNRIDAQVGVKTFAKLVSLPMDFFERASTGVITKNMLQTERVRYFLTGQLFVTLLDAVGLIVLIPLMFAYSAELAVVVLSSAGLLCLVMVVMLPVMGRRMNALYQAEARLQGFLVETIQGMRTVKALALDAQQRRAWDRLLFRAIRRRFAMANGAAIAQTLINPIDKGAQIAVMAMGAYLVFNGDMMVGALIAFKIIAARVTQPLVGLSQMIQPFQEMSLSVRMLGQIMNHPSEQGRTGRGLHTPIEGTVAFTDVRFAYPGSATPALDGVSFTIPKGAMVGVMGRSGSGKTTLTRLLQALHRPQDGMIKIDGHDVRAIDLDHLRTSIGVVLQDSFLFHGTIRENIAAAKPEAAFEDVMEAARLAGADEFIERLPHGFDTMLEEGSSNLSGGQRQRLAIARALLIDPPILILDEATSALDAESEAIVQANLTGIARGRTLIIISHRLSSLVACDSILVMEQGKVADQGRHHDLLGRCDVYRHLWHKQNRHLGLVS